MVTSSKDRWYRDLVMGTISLTLAITFGALIAWAGHGVVVHCFKQDEIFFWVAIAIAILVWFIEEMLHVTLPCRRGLRRLASRLAQLWMEHLHQTSQKTQ